MLYSGVYIINGYRLKIHYIRKSSGEKHMSKSDFIRTAAVSPALKVANTSYNADRIIACAREAADNGAAVILFPELAIPSYTCGP